MSTQPTTTHTKTNGKAKEIKVTEKPKKERKPPTWHDKAKFVDAADNKMTVNGGKIKGRDEFHTFIRFTKAGQEEGKEKRERGATLSHPTQHEAEVRFEKLTKEAVAKGWTEVQIVKKPRKSQDAFAEVPDPAKKSKK